MYVLEKEKEQSRIRKRVTTFHRWKCVKQTSRLILHGADKTVSRLREYFSRYPRGIHNARLSRNLIHSHRKMIRNLIKTAIYSLHQA